MLLQHFDINAPETKPPDHTGWEQTWYGYYYMTKCWSESAKIKWESQQESIVNNGEITERQFERDCFLSILVDIKRNHVNMFELGGGWGEWCMALAGTIDYKIIAIKPKSYRCLSIEGEPTHYHWIRENFEIQHINGEVVHGAVSKKDGVCQFGINSSPDANYGQAVIKSYKFSARKVIGSLINGLSQKSTEMQTIEIPSYSVDKLIQKYNFDHVDIIHMDVQGSEYEVMQGALKSVERDLIDYLLIGVHDKKINYKLKKLLTPKFDLIVDIYPNSLGEVPGFAPIRCGDGIQLYQRKNM